MEQKGLPGHFRSTLHVNGSYNTIDVGCLTRVDDSAIHFPAKEITDNVEDGCGLGQAF